jgi:enhancer of polycomb-like protein
MTLLYEQDHLSLTTDATIPVTLPDGRQQAVLPFRLGPQAPVVRGGMVQRLPPSVHPPHAQLPANLATQTPAKRVTPGALVHTRISHGGMRPPAVPIVVPSPANGASSPPAHAITEVNGLKIGSPVRPSSSQDIGDSPVNAGEPASRSVSPVRPKSSNPHLGVPVMNGYGIPSVNGYPVSSSNGNAYIPHTNGQTGLSPQQVQGLKSAFAMPVGQDMAMRPGFPASAAANVTGINATASTGNLNLKLPASRQMQQMQWLANVHRQPSGEVNGINGIPSHSPNMSHASVNGILPHPSAANIVRTTPSMTHVMTAGQGHASPANTSMSISPHMQHSSPAPVIATYSSPPLSSSPARPSSQASLALSPSMQHQLTSPSLQQKHMVAQGIQGAGY